MYIKSTLSVHCTHLDLQKYSTTAILLTHSKPRPSKVLGMIFSDNLQNCLLTGKDIFPIGYKALTKNNRMFSPYVTRWFLEGLYDGSLTDYGVVS